MSTNETRTMQNPDSTKQAFVQKQSSIRPDLAVVINWDYRPIDSPTLEKQSLIDLTESNHTLDVGTPGSKLARTRTPTQRHANAIVSLDDSPNSDRVILASSYKRQIAARTPSNAVNDPMETLDN
ncbi:hypothetical protein BGX29_006381 [Mortierella sp. GBA35]|nr:hypothetical protein BGX29_006381 [Mortierella sp. GBA35]